MTHIDALALPSNTALTRSQRAVSLAELAVGAGIVIGHNVFHVVPNEVPILFVLALASIRLREGSWKDIGLGRPKSWLRTLAFAFATALVVIASKLFVAGPLSHLLGLHDAKSAGTSIGLHQHDIWSFAKALVISWTFAAFGEEMGYRRYLLGRAADIGDRTTPAWWIALLVSSALFGIGHYYQGSAGMFETACDGFLIGAAYLLSRRNLWVAVLAHGFVDTIVFGALFLGLAD